MFDKFTLKILALGIALGTQLPGQAHAKADPIATIIIDRQPVKIIFVKDGVPRMILRGVDGSHTSFVGVCNTWVKRTVRPVVCGTQVSRPTHQPAVAIVESHESVPDIIPMSEADVRAVTAAAQSAVADARLAMSS